MKKATLIAAVGILNANAERKLTESEMFRARTMSRRLRAALERAEAMTDERSEFTTAEIADCLDVIRTEAALASATAQVGEGKLAQRSALMAAGASIDLDLNELSTDPSDTARWPYGSIPSIGDTVKINCAYPEVRAGAPGGPSARCRVGAEGKVLGYYVEHGFTYAVADFNAHGVATKQNIRLVASCDIVRKAV